MDVGSPVRQRLTGHTIPPMSGLAERNGGRSGLAALAADPRPGTGPAGRTRRGTGATPVFDAAAYATIAANLDRRRGLHAGARRRPSRRAITPPGCRSSLPGIYELSGGVHERTAGWSSPCSARLAVLFTYLIGRRLSGPVGRPDRRRRDRDLSGPARVPGHADGRAAGGGVALGGGPCGALGSGSRRLARGSCRGQGSLRAVHGLSRPPCPRRPRVRWLGQASCSERWLLVRPEYLGIACAGELGGARQDWQGRRRVSNAASSR